MFLQECILAIVSSGSWDEGEAVKKVVESADGREGSALKDHVQLSFKRAAMDVLKKCLDSKVGFSSLMLNLFPPVTITHKWPL